MTTPVSFTVRPPSANRGQGSNRPRAGNWNAPSQRLFNDEDNDDELDNGHRAARRGRRPDEEDRIDGFGANGRHIGGRKSPEPLVIAPQPNRDWREVSRRVPSFRPEGRKDEGPVETHERIGDEPQRSGLRFLNKREPEGEDAKPSAQELAQPRAPLADDPPDVKPLTLDEQALAAVLSGEVPESEDERVKRELIIESAADSRVNPNEADALQRDLGGLPVESTLDDYAAVPVEAFGAAILRGMGYDPKNDTPLHVPKPRPALLGIGATALSSELPPSRKEKDPKKRREAYAQRGGRGYNAAKLLVARNGDSGASTPATGNSSRQTSPGAGSNDSRRRNREGDDHYDSGRESKRRDDRDRPDQRDRDRNSRDDRDRRDRERDRDRRRDREYETDEERARRKARERERERDRNGTDRERSDRDRGDRDRDSRRYRDDQDDRDRRDRRDDRDRRDRDDRRERDRR